MRRFLKSFRYGEKGFTLIELLIVVAILGILAAVIIPNAAGFMLAGTLNAANTEVANVKTAAVGYMAENGVWPANTNATGFSNYYAGTLKAYYGFDATTGLINDADATITDGWGTTIDFDLSDQQWVRGTTGLDIP